MPDLLTELQDWIDIPSVTGDEGDYGDAVCRRLEAEGFAVERQAVEPGRFNVVARADEPEVVFCTHLDTVPPFIGPSADRENVYGRGSCDAKGPALAMIEAARRLLADGERRIGFLLTVGEEVDGAGARFANEATEPPWRPRYTIVGEPTSNRFVRGHKGILKVDLCAHGVAGHSSQKVGPSAVHELVGALGRLIETHWGQHEVFGPGTLNVGCMHGGVAANVVADRATAELVLRIVEDPDVVRERLEAALGERVDVTLSKGYGPVEFEVPDGEEGEVVAFGTDAPFLASWGKPLLYGPGEILDAHTDHERVSRRSFDEACAGYEGAARELLARPVGGRS